MRHRELYEAEYSWQELRLDTLRRRIGARLAGSAPDAAGDAVARQDRRGAPPEPAEGQ